MLNRVRKKETRKEKRRKDNREILVYPLTINSSTLTHWAPA